MRPIVSVILPSIRPSNLEKVYQSIANGCKSYPFEVVIPSPYLIPISLLRTPNVRFLHTYASPVIASQMITPLCRGTYIYNLTDDGLVQEGVIDEAVKMLEQNSLGLNIINMRYDEGVLDAKTLTLLKESHEHFPESYWMAHNDPTMARLAGIKAEWKVCFHFVMRKQLFLNLGGYDCQFEYLNHAEHDFMFRAQSIGCQIINLPRVAFYCSHTPGRTGDHAPVNDAQLGPDTRLFHSIYGFEGAAFARWKINYDNWTYFPNIWSRRFDLNNLPLQP